MTSMESKSTTTLLRNNHLAGYPESEKLERFMNNFVRFVYQKEHPRLDTERDYKYFRNSLFLNSFPKYLVQEIGLTSTEFENFVSPATVLVLINKIRNWGRFANGADYFRYDSVIDNITLDLIYRDYCRIYIDCNDDADLDGILCMIE